MMFFLCFHSYKTVECECWLCSYKITLIYLLSHSYMLEHVLSMHYPWLLTGLLHLFHWIFTTFCSNKLSLSLISSSWPSMTFTQLGLRIFGMPELYSCQPKKTSKIDPNYLAYVYKNLSIYCMWKCHFFKQLSPCLLRVFSPCSLLLLVLALCATLWAQNVPLSCVFKEINALLESSIFC